MLSQKRLTALVSVLLALPLFVAATPAAWSSGVDSNVRVTFTLGKVEAKEKKTPLKGFALVVTSGGARSQMLTGARVPIPKTSAREGEGRPVTSYTYQNVGLSASVEAQILPNGEIRILASVENSWIDPDSAAGQPVVETRHQEVSVVLKDGVALELARSTDGDRIRYVEVRADILN